MNRLIEFVKLNPMISACLGYGAIFLSVGVYGVVAYHNAMGIVGSLLFFGLAVLGWQDVDYPKKAVSKL